MANILLVTHWTSGDVMPFIKMGQAFKQLGHDVTVFTHCIYEEKAKSRGLKFEALDDETEYQDMVSEFPLLSDPIGNFEGALRFQQKHHGAARCLREAERIQAHCHRADTVILLRHRSSFSGLLAAEKSGRPAASVFLAPNYISHLRFHEELFGNAMKEEINQARQRMGLSSVHCWTDWMCSAKRKIALWPEWFAEQEDEVLEGLIHTGFLVDETQNPESFPPELEEFLDEYASPVIITGGTSKMINPLFYKVAVEGCMILKKPAIVVCPFEEFVPRHLPDYIRHFKDVPLRKLMPHACAIIHHGGIGTASEAVACALPQLILAHMADRPDNAHRLKKWGVAAYLPEGRWTGEILADQLSTLDNPQRRAKCLSLREKHLKENPMEKLKAIIDEMAENQTFIPSVDKVKSLMSIDTMDGSSPDNEVPVNNPIDKKKQLLIELLKSKAKDYGMK